MDDLYLSINDREINVTMGDESRTYYSEPPAPATVELPESIVCLLEQIHDQLTRYPENSKTLPTVVSGPMKWDIRNELNGVFNDLGLPSIDFDALIEEHLRTERKRTVTVRRTA